MEINGSSDSHAWPVPIAVAVDDVPFNAELLAMLLQSQGVAALAVTSGAAALSLQATHNVQMLLVDLEMPAMNGLELTSKWRAGEAGVHTPIIGVTAWSDAATHAACREAGMDEVIVKPVARQRLTELVAEFWPGQGSG